MQNQCGSSARLRRQRVVFFASVATVTTLLGVQRASATDRFWKTPADGVYGNGANWMGGTPPGASDTANFNLNSAAAYTVSLGANATVQQMTIDTDRVALNLAGFTLNSTATDFTTPGLAVGQTAGSVGSLAVSGGTYKSTYVRVGDYGTGSLTLTSGKIDSSAYSVYAGFRGGSSGAISVSGAGTTWLSNQHAIGYSGDGTLSITGGASIIEGDSAVLADGGASHATATVSGQGSTWSGANAYFYIGYGGHAKLTVDDLATVSIKGLRIAETSSSVGEMTVTGATAAGRSTLTVDSAFPGMSIIARSGTGSLDITNGALFNNTSDLMVGFQPGGNGALRVNGSAAGFDAEVNSTGNLLVGLTDPDHPEYGGGTGSVTIGANGHMTVGGRTYLGTTGGGTGTLTIDGGFFSTHGLTSSNNSPVVFKSGTFVIDGGSYNPAPASLELAGATAADTATLRFVNAGASMNKSGSLFVGGSATAAGPGAGVLDLQPGADLTFAGPTRIWSGGTLKLAGGTLTTQSLNAADGIFSFTAGGLRLTGSDLSIGSSGPIGSALTLSGAANARNLVSVSGTTTIDPGASLNINGGTFSTGKLVNSGTFAFTTGSFSLTNDSLTIGSGTLLGNTVNLTAGRALSVSGPVTIDPGASLTINGGAFSAPSLINNGSFDFISGTLGGSADLIIDPGKILGNNVSLTAGRNLSASQGLIIGQAGAGTLSISGGGSASSDHGYIAQQPGSTGTVTVDGEGSAFTLASTLTVGGTPAAAGGTGKLTVSNGATVSAGSAIKIYPSATITVDSGTLSGASIANAGAIEIAHAGTIAGAVTNTGTFKKTGGGTSALNDRLTNQTSVGVESGTLHLKAGAVGGGSFTVASGATLRFDGPLMLDPNSSISGSVTGAGALEFVGGTHEFSGAFDVANASIGDARATFPANATVDHLSVSTGNVQGILGAVANGKLSLNQLDYSGGYLYGSGPYNVAGTFNITGQSNKTIDGTTVNLSGASLWTGNGSVLASNGAVINNLAGATFVAQSSGTGPQTVFGSGNSTFVNTGTFNKSAGDGRIEVGSVFNSTGSVLLKAGSLQFTGGGTQSGSINADTGTTLVIGGSNSNSTFTSAATVTTAGNLELRGDTLSFGGHLDVTGSTLVYQATFASGADLKSLGSDFTARGQAFFNTGAPQALPATTLYDRFSRIAGSDTLTTNQPLTWNGGIFSGSGHVTLNAGGSINTSEPKTIDGRIIDNTGLLTWNDGTINQHSTLNNLAGATFDIRGSSPMEYDFTSTAPAPIFNNAGAITKTAGNTTNIYPAFTNSGSVDVQTGMLVFGRGSSSTGSYAVSPGANLVFAFDTHTFSSTASITGGGNLLFTDSDTTFDGSYNIAGSTTVGSPTSSGSLTTVTFNPGAVATSLGSSTTVNRYGTLTFNTGQTVHLHDLAVWGDVAGTDSLLIDGEVTGRGTIQNAIVNEGVVSPGASPGTLAVNGAYKQESAGALKIELASPTGWQTKYVQQYDKLNVNGAANLSGVLNVSLLDGYLPALGETFSIIAFNSHTGTFASVTGQDITPGRRLAVTYGSTGVTLTAVAYPTEAFRTVDADNDGIIAVSDLRALADHYGQAVGGISAGDFNLDGTVSLADLQSLSLYFGRNAPAGTPSFDDALKEFPNLPSVPEPGLVSVLAFAMLLPGRRARGRA